MTTTPIRPQLTQTQLLLELEQVVEGELDRHIAVAKEWFPHEYIPYSDGRTFDGLLGGEAWSPEDSKISDVGKSALVINLLTEDNLPSYHHEIAVLFGRDAAWGDWVHRWTAEEGRHGIALRDYLTVTRAVDPVELERLRMMHISAGYISAHSQDLLRSLAYVSFQELATRVSHRNTGKFVSEPIADQLLTRISADENLHMIFYRNLVKAGLDLMPDQMLRAITDEVVGFAMPGSTIPGFARKAVQIASAGIYDLRIHHDEVISPLLRHWGVFELTGVGEVGEKARNELSEFLGRLDAQATRFESRRADLAAKIPTR